MKIISEKSISDFDTWSGATSTKNKIVEANKESEFDSHIEELYPNGLTENQLNDYLWFEEDTILEILGIEEESEDEEESEEEN